MLSRGQSFETVKPQLELLWKQKLEAETNCTAPSNYLKIELSYILDSCKSSRTLSICFGSLANDLTSWDLIDCDEDPWQDKRFTVDS